MKVVEYKTKDNDKEHFTHNRTKLISKKSLYKNDLWFYKTNPKFKLTNKPGATNFANDIISDAANYIKGFDVAVDIGARVGEWSRPLGLKFNKVLAFEPRDKWCQCFIKNVIMKNITLYDYAIGNEEAFATMAGNSFKKGHTANGVVNYISEQEFLDRKGEVQYSPARIVKLDSFNIDEIDFMKIDVDGFEMDVLLGSESVLLKTKPVIMIECLDKYNYQEHCKYLEDLGAKLKKEYFRPDGRLHDRLYAWN